MDPVKNPDSNGEQMVTSVDTEQIAVSSKQKASLFSHWWVKLLVGFFLFLIVIGGISAYVGLKAKAFYQKAIGLQPHVESLKGNLESQDLVHLKENLVKLHDDIASLKDDYQSFRAIGALPVASSYFRDGQHVLTAAVAGVEAAQVLTDAIEPYADILGFQGSGSFTGGTAEDRIITILQTLDKITPELDDVAGRLTIVDQELQLVDESRYPFTVQGKYLPEEMKQVKEVVDAVTKGVTDAKPALTLLPKLAGMDGERKYLVIFHNDGELRGTGGFMTAYAVLRVEKGRIYPEQSSDIYDLDARFKDRLQPPDSIKKYLKGITYWHLRDMNISPDFKENMDLLTSYSQKVPGFPKIDGVIGVDTNVLVDVLKLFGFVDVPGFGKFTAENDPRCDCPQVVYQLELIADRPVATLVENRKGVMGPLMRELIVKAYDAPTAWWDDLLKIVGENVAGKHIVFYFPDEEFQAAAEKLNAAGRVADTTDDYLMITDVNFGGAKANFFVTQSVTSQLAIDADGTLTRTLTIEYDNPAPASNCNLEAGQLCLNAPMPNYVRIYVPKGSELVESVGLDDAAVVKEELGRTVFEGFVKVNPQSTTKTIYTYALPWKQSDAPKEIVVQKQVGKDSSHYKVESLHDVHEFDLDTDRTFPFR